VFSDQCAGLPGQVNFQSFQGPAGVEVLDSRSLGPVLDEVESKLVEEG